MSFGQPFYLFGLVLIPIALLFMAWAARQRENALTQLGDLGLITRLTGSINQRGRRWRQRFWLIGVALVLFALARPQWGSATQVVAQEGIQIMVALDISESMLAQDLQPDRLTRAKQTIIELMDQLRGDQVGVALFSGAAFIQFPITSDYATAKAFLLSANPSMISRGGTNLTDAIRTARSGFDDQRASQKVIIVMTDGETHEGNPLGEAQRAAEAGVIIYTIGFGSFDPTPIPQFNQIGQLVGYKQDRTGQVVQTTLNDTVLREIASETDGEYFRASASGDEIEILAQLIAQLESAELDSRFEVQAVERFQLFLLLAIICFVVAELVPERKNTGRLAERLVGLFVVGFFLTGCVGGDVPRDAAQLVTQGNEQFSAEAYDDAIAAYTDARASGVASGEPLYNTANAQFKQSAYAESAETMQSALDIADDALSAAAWFNLGNTYFIQEDWPQAIEAYKAALRIDPADVDAKHNLELALQQMEQPPEDGDGSEQEDEQTPDEQANEDESGGEDEEENQEEQGGGEGEQEATPTPQPEGESENEEDSEPQEQEQEQEPTPESEGQDGGEEPSEDESPAEADPNTQGEAPPPPPSGELTEEQALQLLDAVEQDTETLQERLNQSYTEPGPPPDKDW